MNTAPATIEIVKTTIRIRVRCGCGGTTEADVHCGIGWIGRHCCGRNLKINVNLSREVEVEYDPRVDD